MNRFRLNDMIRGWFVGDFDPNAYRTDAAEVGIKQHRAGDREDRHLHKIATEITVVVHGDIMMNGASFGPGDIVVLKPGEWGEFSAITDCDLVVVKIPGAKNDKYLSGE